MPFVLQGEILFDSDWLAHLKQDELPKQRSLLSTITS